MRLGGRGEIELAAAVDAGEGHRDRPQRQQRKEEAGRGAQRVLTVEGRLQRAEVAIEDRIAVFVVLAQRKAAEADRQILDRATRRIS